ncbi:MAG TPA: hypothetical protein VFW87_23780 [Pirellulales bacterium]|nr:hypothetical protein [Pirellulales bacterium]
MPDFHTYGSALALAAGITALVALAVGALRPPASLARRKVACVMAVAAGLASGGYVLQWPVAWPPTSGLGRLLTIVLPLAIVIELISAATAVPRRLVWCCRLALAMSIGRILLHGSIYLSGDTPEWSVPLAAAIHLISGSVLMVVWALLIWLSHRSGGASLCLALAQAALAGGLATMLAGYLGGGAAALPLAGALAGCALACGLRKLPGDSFEGAVSLGAVALFGLLFIGHFFGQLSTGRALTVFLAPLLCLVTELPVLRRRPAWQTCLLRLVLAAIPLIAVVALAKRDFDHDTLPLLSQRQAQPPAHSRGGVR